MSGFQSWVLSTLAGWVVAMVLIVVGGRWVAAMPPPGASPDVRPQEPPRPAPSVAAGVAVAATPSAREAGTATPTPLPLTQLVVADPAGVNLRAEPTTASAIVASLPRGTLVEAHPGEAASEGAEWRRVTWNGRAGWVLARLVQPPDGARCDATVARCAPRSPH